MSDFDQLQSAHAAGGADAALAQAATLLGEQQKYHELFEVLKMQLRRKLGLPLLYGDAGDDLSEARRTQLEEGLIDACRTVGNLLLREGKIREGWMYLRPVGEKAEAAKLLAAIEPTEENTEELIEVCLHEGIDIGRGFGLVLSSYGTCSSITTYDNSVARRPRLEQQPAARQLLHRVHADLVASVKLDIARQEGSQPAQATLQELLHDRDWLFQENAYHLDTTHLAATVRIARALSDPADLRLALDLTEYGRRLSQQFQYQGDEPFAEMYPAHGRYFQALLGEEVEAALDYFKTKAEMLDPQYHGLAAVETYVDLLTRVGRYPAAIAAAIKLGPKGIQPIGQAPSLLELAEKSGDYAPVLDYCRERGDLLGYAAALVQGKKG
ncbi:MAG: hypothetical protein WD872_12050 [Pirellulaceae bacterium]